MACPLTRALSTSLGTWDSPPLCPSRAGRQRAAAAEKEGHSRGASSRLLTGAARASLQGKRPVDAQIPGEPVKTADPGPHLPPSGSHSLGLRWGPESCTVSALPRESHGATPRTTLQETTYLPRASHKGIFTHNGTPVEPQAKAGKLMHFAPFCPPAPSASFARKQAELRRRPSHRPFNRCPGGCAHSPRSREAGRAGRASNHRRQLRRGPHLQLLLKQAAHRVNSPQPAPPIRPWETP